MFSKKIIFIHLLNDYSGSPKVLSQVIKTVQAQGCDVELYTGKSPAKEDDGFLSGVTPKHSFYFYQFFENKYFTLITFMLSQFILFFKLLKYWNKDVTFYINTMLPFGAALAGWLMRKPVVYHIHETSLKPAIFKRFLRFFIQKSATQIIFVSQAVEQTESFSGINQVVIHNALAHSFFVETEQHHYPPLIDGDSDFNVLMICSLKAYKGINEFIEIAALCLSTSKIQFTLLFNAKQQDIDDFFKAEKLPDNIILVHQQKNVLPYYAQASLLLNLSRPDEWVETFGLTIIEAMAFAIPVIVPPVGGPVEIVTDGEEGYLISCYETEHIAEKIIELSQNKVTI